MLISEQYSRVCLVILSEPLHDDIALPATAQAFFLGVCERAVQTPCATNLGFMQTLLTGACQDLLGLIPRATLKGLEDQLFRILRNLRAAQDQSPALLCLAVIAAIDGSCRKTRPLGDAPISYNPEGCETAFRFGAYGEFFTGAKAAKTLQLLSLRAIWACKENSGVPIRTAIADMRIANETIAAVDPLARQKWSQCNQPVLQKLMEKALRSDISQELQLEVSESLPLTAT